MNPDTTLLVVTAASVGFLHTVLGPDHYLPFVAMSRAGSWSRTRTLVVTALCGVGHVAGSVVLGLVGIAFGLSLTRLEGLEAVRGSLAAWGLILFGLAYTVWGVRKALRGHRHTHLHAHPDGTVHLHEHTHAGEHAHPHPGRSDARMTPWVLFVIFLFGPCEALIPLLMFPAAMQSVGALLLVTLTFGTVTVATMLGLVLVGSEGIRWLPLRRLEPYAHAVAGVVVLLCGVAIQFLGL
jgi:ABC-type nickel/cobalt efflux system permease component RcnA